MTSRTVLALSLVAAALPAVSCGDDRVPTASTSLAAPLEPDDIAVTGTPAAAARAASIYVSPNGSDLADGRSPDTALATIALALSVVQPGETVRILSGIYTESVQARLRGRAEAPITITGEWGRPILTGGRRLATGIWCEECTHVIFENLEFRDYTDIGLVVVLGDTIRMSRLWVHDNGFAPTISWVEGYGLHLDDSSGLTVENNQVFRNGPNPRTPTTVGTGINGFGMRQSVIRNNWSYGNQGGGILVEDSFGILVEGNQIFDNDLDVTADDWWDGGIWLDGGGDVTLRGNTIRNNLGPGIEVSDENIRKPTGYVIENNVSSGNYYGIYIWNFGSTEIPTDAMRLSGNDFSGSSRQDVWIEAIPCPTPCD